jgi:hypothetical protein
MATENERMVSTILAGEDLSSLRYHAVDLSSGKLANNAGAASGILLGKPKLGEFATIGYLGEMKYVAGAAVTIGSKLTVTTSGWLISAGSDSTIVGVSKTTVTSGSLGTGFFSFPSAGGTAPDAIYMAKVAGAAILGAGIGINLVTGNVAANALTTHGLSTEVATQGSSTPLLLWGRGLGRMAPSQASSLGNLLTTTASGYLTLATTGDYVNATALANIGSGASGSVMFWGGMHGYYS